MFGEKTGDMHFKVSFVSFLAFSLILYFGKDVLLPVAITLFLYFLVSPLVGYSQSIIRRWLKSFLVVLFLALGCGLSFYHLSVPLYNIGINSVKNIKILKEEFVKVQKPLGEINNAAKQMEDIGNSSVKKPLKVEIDKPSTSDSVLNYVSIFVKDFGLVLVLLFFLLVYGDDFFKSLRKLVEKNHKMKTKKPILNEVKQGIFTYLMTVTLINLFLGAAISIYFWALGFENYLLWGLMAFLLNFMPYVGCVMGVVAAFLTALGLFDSWFLILAAPLGYLTINTFEGQFITPTTLGKTLTLNPLMIVLSVLYWGFLWGFGGVFVAVPVLVLIKVFTCEAWHLEEIAELIQGRSSSNDSSVKG